MSKNINPLIKKQVRMYELRIQRFCGNIGIEPITFLNYDIQNALPLS